MFSSAELDAQIEAGMVKATRHPAGALTMLREGLDIAGLTNDVPAEFRAWISAMQARCVAAYRTIEAAARQAFEALPGRQGRSRCRAEESLRRIRQAQGKDLAPILFAMIQATTTRRSSGSSSAHAATNPPSRTKKDSSGSRQKLLLLNPCHPAEHYAIPCSLPAGVFEKACTTAP